MDKEFWVVNEALKNQFPEQIIHNQNVFFRTETQADAWIAKRKQMSWEDLYGPACDEEDEHNRVCFKIWFEGSGMDYYKYRRNFTEV